MGSLPHGLPHFPASCFSRSSGTDHRGRPGGRESLSPDLSSIVLLSRVQRISSKQ
jgi:hypothetical protein